MPTPGCGGGALRSSRGACSTATTTRRLQLCCWRSSPARWPKSATVLAADFAQRRVVESIGADIERKDLLMRSVGRAVWQRGRRLAMRLPSSCPVAAEHAFMRGGLPDFALSGSGGRVANRITVPRSQVPHRICWLGGAPIGLQSLSGHRSRQMWWNIGLLRMAGDGPPWSVLGPVGRCLGSCEPHEGHRSGRDGLRYAAGRRAGRTAGESLSGLMWAVMGGALCRQPRSR